MIFGPHTENILGRMLGCVIYIPVTDPAIKTYFMSRFAFQFDILGNMKKIEEICREYDRIWRKYEGI